MSTMSLRKRLSRNGHEQLVVCNDESTGLFSIIAIHDTTLGPALGGCRMRPYDTMEEALEDVLRLSRGMTYKASLAGINLGGGKAVIIGDSKTDKHEGLFRMFGQYVDSLGGRYITAEDLGTGVQDMSWVMKETEHVVGGPAQKGGSGDPSPYTALGVYEGILATLQVINGTDSLKGISVAVQGVGHVGKVLVKHLVENGAKVFIADIEPSRIEALCETFPSIEVVSNEEILGLDVDIYSPCALGAVIDDTTIDDLKVKAIVGSANNQLKEDRHGEALYKREILYAPDYCVNAGGLISVYYEVLGKHEPRVVESAVYKIRDSLKSIYDMAMKENMSTSQAADCLAIKRIQNAREKMPYKQLYRSGRDL